MSQKQEIEVIISEEGLIKYHIRGIKGAKCVDLAKVFAQPLGKIENIQHTSEYYQQEEKNTNRQKLK